MKNTFHVIKDPVHGTMQFTSAEDSWVKPFIDSPNFQRLRHIKQLGMGDYIFPGAVHTRFNHCMGCCYVGSQIAQKIGLNDSERQLVMIACLLHDIGHGPFSHAFEGVFHNKSIQHEDWTPYFLMDYETRSFFASYNNLNPKHPLTEEKFNEIGKMIMHQPVAKQILADIVSSQLDADRLDYLLRDSHFCGVRYGEFDFRWMLHCLTIAHTEAGDRLGITHKGVGVTEHYLMARRLLTRNLCHSQKKLAIEEYLVQLLACLAESVETYGAYKKIRDTLLGEFLIAANHYNQTAKKQENNDELKREFIKENYALYKELCDYDVYAVIKELSQMDDEHPAIQIATRIQHRIMPEIVRINYSKLKDAQAELTDFKKKHRDHYQDWQLILTKSPHRSYSGEDDPIYVVDEYGAVSPIGEYSIMIDAISDRLEHVAFLAVDKMIADDKPVKDFMRHLQSTTTMASV